MIIDDNRIILRKWADVILGDREAAKYVSGVAVHWYMNRLIGPSVLDMVHQSFPDKFILATEACAGYGLTTVNKVKLGSWERAEYYASDILGNLNHWATGWTDWNLVLNIRGGPNWARNFVDSPIIVNATAQEFYKQPMYYAIGHFSKFIPPGSVRIDSRLIRAGLADLSTKLEYAAFLTPEQAIVVIVLNKSNSRYPLNIRDTHGSANAQKIINERSITTFIWQPFGVKPQRPISVQGVKATPYGPAKAVVPECQKRDYGRGSVVCVCNTTYCDFAGDVPLPPSGSAFAYESSKGGLRFNKTTIPLSRAPPQDTSANDSLLLVLDSSKMHQIVYGFGGAFTDAAGINVKSLPEKLQDDLIKSYYAKEGLAYNMGRVPLASTDFSERKYTYDDTPGDLELTNFALAQEDLDLKIPYIKKATSLVTGPLLLIGSAWSSPAWMKTSNSLEGEGVLIGEPGSAYYKSWAKYYARFLQEYGNHGIRFYGVTA
ncbi:hypothetical protein MTO96_022124 [Rhipicephalus appendiculatus]